MDAEMENAEGHDWKVHEDVQLIKLCNDEEMHLYEDMEVFIDEFIKGNNLSLWLWMTKFNEWILD